MRKQVSGSVVGILLVVVVSLMALVGCSPTPVGSGSDAASVALPDAAGGSRNAGGVRPGDTNVTNLVASGDVEVGGDLTVSGECVGCGAGTMISTLDDIPTLSASQPMTVTNLTVGGTCTGCGGGASYLSYVAHLSQVGTGAPTVTVLTNELSGPVVWTRQDAGNYWGTLTGGFPISRTLVFLAARGDDEATPRDVIVGYGGYPNILRLIEVNASDGNEIDLEVRVYP